ncbi:MULTISPECIES: sugar ABC transporter ATP-binding protein [unclassified Conexibacter]|uniref:sugar ABC transporter ATP-binding protein n=1 Tax=unclassified Conexibacter TaxID=2627773 RepID=UPI00351C9027
MPEIEGRDGAAVPVLEARAVSKVFGGTVALDHVDLSLRAGEIHALLGENGAGKSTLTRILCGVHRPDTGELRVDGAVVDFHTPAAAQEHDIAILHQEPSLFGDLEVAENVFVGRQPKHGRPPRIDRRAMRAEAAALLAELGAELDPAARVADLSLAEAQLVEMAGALSRRARVLIVDEPTAALTPGEVGDLFRVLRGLRDRGVAILFIGHRLEEIFALADRITVLRDGRFVDSRAAADHDEASLIRAMVGRDVAALHVRTRVEPGEPLLQVRGLARAGVFEAVDLDLRSGEIVGLAGLVGAGRTEVARAVFGIDRRDAGTVELAGERLRTPQQAMRAGLAFVPEDRQREGVAVELPIAANVALPILGRVAFHGWLRPGRERALAREWGERLRLKARDVEQAPRELSGGNQQKVVLAKWLATRPRVLILDEPTRGVDVGAKVEIHRLIDELAAAGMAILLISSDLPEVLALSDRVLVMREGRVTAALHHAEATPERVMQAATAEAQAVAA